MMIARSIEDWISLPELPMGDHVLTNAGFVVGPIPDCRRLGVPGIPDHFDNDPRMAATLPTVTVLAGGDERLYRLHPDFGPVVRKMAEEARRIYEHGGRRLLPARYTLGIREDGAFAFPTDEPHVPINVAKNPPPPVEEQLRNRPWKRKH